MPRTPDRFPGEREDEGILLEVGAVVPAVNGEIRYVTGVGFRFYEEGLERGLDLAGGPSLTTLTHRAIRQLIHFIEDGPAEGFATGAYCENLPAGDPFPTSITWWTSSAKTSMIVEELITYNANNTVDTDTWHIYDTDGTTLLGTVVDTISYSGVFETSRTRVISFSGPSLPVTESSHPALRQLIHFIEDGPAEGFTTGAYCETLPAADPFPTSITWWESASMTEKIVEQLITYNANMTIATETWNMYDTDGTTLLSSIVDTYSYSGVIETSRTRTIS